MPDDINRPGEPPHFIEPRATEHIEEMKALIERLVASGHAYVAEDHVLFAVASMPDYGRLSKRPLDEMIAGARVEVAPYKRDAMDFVLWKPSKPGEPAWPSPCGIAAPGRPGWHVECSAMSDHWLWTKAEPRLSAAGLAHPHEFDIHGGGVDLVFPHHENEIAQSRCGFHTPVMANYWMHNGFLMVEGEKMAKSLGNFVTIRDVLQTEKFGGRSWDGNVLRLAMLMTHYRQPIDWTLSGLEVSFHTLDTWFRAANWSSQVPPADSVVEALADDLNTPKVIAELHAIARRIRTNGAGPEAKVLGATLAFLGFKSESFWLWYDAIGRKVLDDVSRIETLVDARNVARKAKDFKEADRIRDELLEMGIVLKDTKDGTTWEVAR